MSKKTKGRILYEETFAMLNNIKNGRRVHYLAEIDQSVCMEEEVQYGIIIGRFYYAFLLIVKEMNNWREKKPHRLITNNSNKYEVCEAFESLFDLRKKADYHFNNLHLKKKWEVFERRYLPYLVQYYIK